MPATTEKTLNEPVPEVYDNIPNFDHNVMLDDIFEDPETIRYKIGNNYYIYKSSVNTPLEIQLHALLSKFENYLRILRA